MIEDEDGARRSAESKGRVRRWEKCEGKNVRGRREGERKTRGR